MSLLPEHVAFQHHNGKYLSAKTIDGKNYLKLTSAGQADVETWNQTFTEHDKGCFRIKSQSLNMFWKRDVEWIYANYSDDTDHKTDLLFQPHVVGVDTVALLNMGNSKYCMPVTDGNVVDCLKASSPTDDNVDTHWTVHDLTTSRHIHNVNFRLLDARTYDQSVVVMASGVAVNKTQVDNMAEVKLSYTDKKTTTWDATASLKLGVKTTIKAAIPLIITAQGNIELDEFNGEYKWGATEEHTTVVDTVYKVTVPPMTTVTVTLLATKASCDVPFSYTQRDLLTNGHQVSRDMDDGVYTSTNFYNFKYETKQTKL